MKIKAKFEKGNESISLIVTLTEANHLLVLDVGTFHFHAVFIQFNHCSNNSK